MYLLFETISLSILLYKFNLIDCLLRHFFYLDCTYTDRAKSTFQLEIPADENFCMFWCADNVPAIKIFAGITF